LSFFALQQQLHVVLTFLHVALAVYLSALVRDCDIAASVLDVGDADLVRALWQKMDVHMILPEVPDETLESEREKVNGQRSATLAWDPPLQPSATTTATVTPAWQQHYHNFKLAGTRHVDVASENGGLLGNLLGPHWRW
jgi:hypothetical protein